MNIGAILFLLVGIFSLGYLTAIILYAGVKTAFLWFWIMAGIGSLIISAALRFMYNQKIESSRQIKISVYVLILIGITFFTIVEGIIIYNGNSKPDNNAEYVIILGAQVKGTRISRALKNRLDTAYKYLTVNTETKVIVSGGQGYGEDISEAEAMRRYLIGQGIDNKRIIMEDKSTNTSQNIKFSKGLMVSENATAVLVTNRFHVFRAMSIARKQGIIHVQGLGAPNDDILTLSYYIREFFAVVKDKVVGNI